MNQGQEMFYNFILERVKEDKVEDAKNLLGESFAKQANGSFNQAYIAEFAPMMMAMLKPEHVTEVTEIMKNFSNNLKG